MRIKISLDKFAQRGVAYHGSLMILRFVAKKKYQRKLKAFKKLKNVEKFEI